MYAHLAVLDDGKRQQQRSETSLQSTNWTATGKVTRVGNGYTRRSGNFMIKMMLAVIVSQLHQFV